MERQPFSSHVLTFLLFTILLLISNWQATLATNATKTKTTVFITNACKSVTYPELCMRSLSSYAFTIKTNPTKLATAALTVSISAAQNTSSLISKLLQKPGLSRFESATLKDCLSQLGDGIGELNDSLKALKKLNRANMRFQIANVQTWVSAALTNDDTCNDGVSDKHISTSLKNSVKKSVLNLAMLTSNALSIYVARRNPDLNPVSPHSGRSIEDEHSWQKVETLVDLSPVP
ncbi:Pectinesterase inhibitor domain [Dillenia turbinata]|uniref:pectinesterase n=1 Tax=Dillenia turbinata TaxID=194707 RepID=A0AAN8ZAF9_9MAGN